MLNPVPTIQLTATIEWSESPSGCNPRDDYSSLLTLQFFNARKPVPMRRRDERGVTDHGADGVLEGILDEYDTKRLVGALHAHYKNDEDAADSVDREMEWFLVFSPLRKLQMLCRFDHDWVKAVFAYWGGVSHGSHSSVLCAYSIDNDDNGVMFAKHTHLANEMPWLYAPRADSDAPVVPLDGALTNPYSGVGTTLEKQISESADREWQEYVAWANGEMVVPRVTFELPAPDLYPPALKSTCRCCGNPEFRVDSLLPSESMDGVWYGFDQYDSSSADDGDAVWENLSAIEAFRAALNMQQARDQVMHHHRHGLCTDRLSLLLDVPLHTFASWNKFASNKKDSIAKLINELQAQLDVM